MRSKLFLIVVVLLISGCAGAGGLKPSVYTAPPSYLSSFPLGTISENEMILKSGPPDGTIMINDKKALVYKLGSGLGERSFTYIFENGVINDVIYNDHGPYNGSTARKYQNK